MDKNEELLKLLLKREEEPQNIKEFLRRFLIHWKWFLLAGFMGIAIAYLITRYTPPTYQVKSVLLVKDSKSEGLSLENIFSGSSLNSDLKLDNHIGILSSLSLNHQVLENLQWYVSWYKKMPLGDFNLYGKEPFHVNFNQEAFNLHNVPIFVSAIDDERFTVKVDSKANVLGIPTEVSFEKEGRFGELFENQYFSFTIQKTLLTGEDNYYFVFNDFDKLTLNAISRLSVSATSKNGDLLRLQLSGQNPDQAITYLNELGKVYQEYGLKQKNQISENTIQFIDNQLDNLIDTLRTTSNQFTEYRSSNKVFDLGTEASLVAEKLSDLDSKRTMAKMQLEYYQNLSKYITEEGNMKNMVVPSVAGISDQGLNSMVVRLSELHAKKENLSFSLSSNHPGLQQIDQEINFIQKSLKENLNNLIFNATNELTSINDEIAKVNEQLSRYPKTEQDLINIKRMVDLNNELYNFLLQKRAEAQITKASNIPDIEVLDAAQKATVQQLGPKSKLNYMIGLILGLAVPFLIILIRDFFDETLQSREQLQRLTDVPVATDIPHSLTHEKLPVVEHPRSVLAESFRELRTNMSQIQKEDGKDHLVIGVHSLIPGEGKSFVSANLACMFALNNRKTVIVGADLRNPTIGHYFKIDSKAGLSTYLVNRHSLKEIVFDSGVKNLEVIPSGAIPPNPVELLDSPAFSALMDDLTSRYDVVIIDNSPITLVTDASMTSEYCDSNLFVVRQKHSPKKLIQSLKLIVNRNKMKNSGIVFNDINPKQNGSYVYRYGAYYRKALHDRDSKYFFEN